MIISDLRCDLDFFLLRRDIPAVQELPNNLFRDAYTKEAAA